MDTDPEKLSIIGLLMFAITAGGAWLNNLIKKKDATIEFKEKIIVGKDDVIREMYTHQKSMHEKMLEVVNKNTQVSEQQISALKENTKSSDSLKETISNYVFTTLGKKS